MQGSEIINILPELKSVIEYVGAAATGGIIGNRFVNLYYHEKQRILRWVQSWTLTQADREVIDNNEEIRLLFSQVTSSVANEIFEKKILIWPLITESLLRNQEFEFNEKQYFINLFLRTDPFTIHYLAKLDIEGPIDYSTVFPNNDTNRPPLGHQDIGLNLGQLQSAYSGTTDLVYDGTETKIKISELGKRFLYFISNSSKKEIIKMAEQ